MEVGRSSRRAAALTPMGGPPPGNYKLFQLGKFPPHLASADPGTIFKGRFARF